ncbi:MAG: type III ribulose-bisphosphate carboxylase [Candidatus Bathyarchaeia archaeon]
MKSLLEEELDFEWYLDLVTKGYEPSEDELIVLFKARPAEGVTLEDAAGRIASESSVGTWTTLSTLTEDVKELMAKAYSIDEKGLLKVSYPLRLFELGNIVQLFSSVLGNIFGMKAIKTLKVLDIGFPKAYLEAFNGPYHGMDGVKDIMKVYDRPLLATVPKPKLGLDVESYARVAYDIALGGMDLVKDDENLTSQSFITFEKRLAKVMKSLERAEKETGERKAYLINVSSETREMCKRIKLVADYGNPFIMIDILCVGLAGWQTAKGVADEYKLAIHAHRAFHAAFTRSPEHGVSFFTIAKLARLVGVDHIHVGTNVGKLETDIRELKNIQRVITEEKFIPEQNDFMHMPQDWHGKKPVMPVASGGLHPGTLPELIKFMGTKIMIQVGGGVTGHPEGVIAGGRAVRQALEAIKKGIPLKEYSKENHELAVALKKWGYVRPI